MIKIRKAIISDSDDIWELMRKLAVFENYIDDFAITPDIVREKGFIKNSPDFHCLVANDNSRIAGILVYYFIPYTLYNRPIIYMKELFVDEHYRGQKIGEKLMEALKKEGVKHNCVQIKWNVASWNENGKKFYEKQGAKENKEWVNYELYL